MADRRKCWILAAVCRGLVIACVIVVADRLLCGCSAADFTVAEPLTIEGADAIAEADPSDTRIDEDAGPTSPDGADAAPLDTAGETAPAGDTETTTDTHAPPPDAAADTHPAGDTAVADTATADTGKVACANLSPTACAAYACDEPTDCPGGGRCCLVPDGGGSTCACSNASMDSWIVLCRTEADCGGIGHCTPWDAWTGHGRCL